MERATVSEYSRCVSGEVEVHYLVEVQCGIEVVFAVGHCKGMVFRFVLSIVVPDDYVVSLVHRDSVRGKVIVGYGSAEHDASLGIIEAQNCGEQVKGSVLGRG